MLAFQVGAPAPGVFCLKTPLYSICESNNFIFLGSNNLQVGWLQLASGRSEFTNFAADQNNHKDDQIISIQEYRLAADHRLFVQSKGGWFGIIKISVSADQPTKCILELEQQLSTDFVGFAKFPLITFESTEEDHRSFVKKFQPQKQLVVPTNSLDAEGKLHLLTIGGKGIQITSTISEACRFIDPQPV